MTEVISEKKKDPNDEKDDTKNDNREEQTILVIEDIKSQKRKGTVKKGFALNFPPNNKGFDLSWE